MKSGPGQLKPRNCYVFLGNHSNITRSGSGASKSSLGTLGASGNLWERVGSLQEPLEGSLVEQLFALCFRGGLVKQFFNETLMRIWSGTEWSLSNQTYLNIDEIWTWQAGALKLKFVNEKFREFLRSEAPQSSLGTSESLSELLGISGSL